MRALFMIAVTAPALLNQQDLGNSFTDGGRCGEFHSMMEHQATALQRISDCLVIGTKAEQVECTAQVLTELDD
jgi:hypothetical protein